MKQHANCKVGYFCLQSVCFSSSISYSKDVDDSGYRSIECKCKKKIKIWKIIGKFVEVEA